MYTLTESSRLNLESSGSTWNCWCRHADAHPEREAIVHLALGETPYRWNWGELVRAASSVASWLAEQGVRKGDVCGLIVRHHKFFYPLYLGVSALGALPAVLAYPNARLHPDKFREGLEGMSTRSGLDCILTEHDLADIVGPLVSGRRSTIKSVLYPIAWMESQESWLQPYEQHPNANGNEPCLLQHSSGTTGLQKPVVLTSRAVLEHVGRYAEAIELRPHDKVVSWLPLYHDMGLIAAFYLPLVACVPVVQLSPIEWVSAPSLLLRAITEEAATLCWLPNFAYNLMADRIREDDLQEVRLNSIRKLVNCSEPVRAESHRKFLDKFSPYGLKPEALSCCYAMAETTFAVTQTPPDREPRLFRADRASLARGNVLGVSNTDDGRVCVSSGIPIAGCSVRLVDENRNDVLPNRVGEIAVSSVSLFEAYRNYPDKTAEVLQDGWYFTGDYGFIEEGELFVIGRKKDVIIVAGNNICPEDVEDAVGQIPGVVPGRVVAFGADDETNGTEMVCVIAETTVTVESERRSLKMAILKATMSIDVTVSRVYIVEPRWMIKSSSGKPSRSANKARALAELSWI